MAKQASSPMTVCPSAAELREFIKKTQLVNLDAPIKNVLDGAQVLGNQQGRLHFLMISGYFLIYDEGNTCPEAFG